MENLMLKILSQFDAPGLVIRGDCDDWARAMKCQPEEAEQALTLLVIEGMIQPAHSLFDPTKPAHRLA